MTSPTCKATLCWFLKRNRSRIKISPLKGHGHSRSPAWICKASGSFINVKSV